ncbi:metal ABC transporter solute-binding protein, Zn/Mn family [Xylanimonas protaetiae]|uniref:Zinc ABC transporter substrate-binding protein n=1 Tax=Xylanimonas protaetiae TaxID=2509457 RepID=A0A4P6F4J2_9MICO|nr:zinc ABC transporter substrate-binding protein [Xylanimonas protaetiae]QAY70225.1 zinc ABC transporter substrate-binding protein [Xylanimonas protaetiae]
MFRRRRFLVAAAALPVALVATALATTSGSAPAADADDARLQVVTSFYPLQFVAERVAGDLADVDNLTPPAADPHHLELSLARVRDVGNADVVVTLGGFMHAVDAAVEAQQPARVVDAAEIVDLLPASLTGGHTHEDGVCTDPTHDHSHDHGDDADHEHSDDHAHSHDHEHATEDHAHSHDHASDDHGHDHGHAHDIGGYDPHFWLDPIRLAQVAGPVADALAEADPDNAAVFHDNAAALERELAELDAEIAEALAPFAGAKLVTNHTAFGYLAERYGIRQIGITGLDHSIEPSPARMREIGDVVREHNVGTIFYETLVSPRVVQTLASDLGVNAAVLDTLEGLTVENAAAGEDFISLMRSNLDALTQGLVAP